MTRNTMYVAVVLILCGVCESSVVYGRLVTSKELEKEMGVDQPAEEGVYDGPGMATNKLLSRGDGFEALDTAEAGDYSLVKQPKGSNRADRDGRHYISESNLLNVNQGGDARVQKKTVYYSTGGNSLLGGDIISPSAYQGGLYDVDAWAQATSDDAHYETKPAVIEQDLTDGLLLGDVNLEFLRLGEPYGRQRSAAPSRVRIDEVIRLRYPKSDDVGAEPLPDRLAAVLSRSYIPYI